MSRDTTTPEYLCVLCTRTVIAFVRVVYWQGCPPAVIPKLCAAIPGVPYHLMHVSLSCIVQQSTVGNMQRELSCTCKTPVLPSGNIILGQCTCIWPLLCSQRYSNRVLQYPVLLWGPTTLCCSGSNSLWPSAVSYWDPPFASGDQQLDCSK